MTFYKAPKLWKRTADGKAIEEISPPVEATGYPRKEANFFYHPQWVYQPRNFLNDQPMDPLAAELGGFTFQHNTKVEAQIQIGSKLIPKLPIRSSADAFYQLRKSLGPHQPGSSYAIYILDREYRTSKFILAFDI